MTVSSSATATMRSLDRAIDVLEVLEDAHTGLRLSEIARRADLHVATTQRILGALEARGRVERDDSRYRAGAALLFGAHAYLTKPVTDEVLLQSIKTALPGREIPSDDEDGLSGS